MFPAWFPELTARADLSGRSTEVTLEHNVVAGADTMAVYETAWRRARQPAPLACPSAPGLSFRPPARRDAERPRFGPRRVS